MKRLEVKLHDKRMDAIEEINMICAENCENICFILGGGIYGKVIAQYLKDNGLKPSVQYVIDDEYITDENVAAGMISFSAFLKEYALSVPLIFGFYNYEIIQKKRAQYKDVVKYMYDFHITVVNDIRVGWNSDYVKEHYNEFNTTFEMFIEEKSRYTMQCYIDAATVGDFERLFLECHEEIPYFNDVLKNVKINKLFDCGAFDGDSIHDFIGAFDSYKEIYAIEPDKNNVDKIKQRVERENIVGLNIIEKGVFSQTTTLHFLSEGKSSSHISENGDVSIDVIKLDDLYDIITSDSLIKMDIEGSELEALKGAQKVIRDKSPVLAICVYHKREDLITIPQFIDSIVNPGTYRYYLRFQGLDLAELVFFAVPK